MSGTTYLQRGEDREVYNQVYRDVFGKDFPARTTIAVDFTTPGMLIEISCIAAMPG